MLRLGCNPPRGSLATNSGFTLKLAKLDVLAAILANHGDPALVSSDSFCQMMNGKVPYVVGDTTQDFRLANRACQIESACLPITHETHDESTMFRFAVTGENRLR